MVFLHCVSCGYSTAYEIPWRRQFRAIYKTPDGGGEIHLSGVDCTTSKRNSYVTFIPIDPALCPATEYEPDDVKCHIQFGKEAADMLKANPCRQNAFFFHESCWEALTEHFRPGELDLNRVFVACRVAPRSQIQEKRYGRTDPHDGLAIEELERFARDFPKPNKKVRATATAIAINDCFSCLLLEICEAVAVDLPTNSFLNLRYTSRAMGILFDSPVFWKSRFSPYGERGYLHIPIKTQQKKIIQRNKNRKSKKKIDCNWRLFYHCTNPTTCARMTDLALQVKKQIWEQIWTTNKWLRDTSLIYHISGDGARYDWCLRHDIRLCPLAWWEDPDERKSLKYTQQAYVGPSVSGIKLFVLRRFTDNGEDEESLISGIELTFDDRPAVRLGYVTTEAYSFDAKLVKGFNASVGRDVIHALQPITSPSSPSSSSSGWVGKPCNADSTHQLALDEVDEIGCIFDSNKIRFYMIKGIDWKEREDWIQQMIDRYNRYGF